MSEPSVPSQHLPDEQAEPVEPHLAPPHPTNTASLTSDTSPHLARPPEVSNIEIVATVELPEEDTIVIADALAIAERIGFRIAKSTLQRWAMRWSTLGTASPVRALLVTTRTGNSYRLSRSDFEVWAMEQKDNLNPARTARPFADQPAEPERSPAEPAAVAPQETPEPHPERSPDTFKDRLIEQLQGENNFLRDEIRIKNDQLKDATERSKETNILIHGLQNLVLKLTGQLPNTREIEPPRSPGAPLA